MQPYNDFIVWNILILCNLLSITYQTNQILACGKIGEPRKHILGNPLSVEEKVELVNKYSLLPSTPKIDGKQIHLHQYAHHLNSTQIMCYNFFRPLIENYDGKMYRPKDSLHTNTIIPISWHPSTSWLVLQYHLLMYQFGTAMLWLPLTNTLS